MSIIQRIILFSLFFVAPLVTRAAGTDIGFAGGTQDIFFSSPRFVVGEPIRIYARVHNFGDVDMSAQVVLYQGSALIGDPQIISIRAKGLSDEVYVDWKVPDGSFNIRAEVKAQYPRDENSANDIALTPLITPEKPAPPPPQVSTASPPSASGGSGKTATSVGSIAERKGTALGALIDEVKKTVIALAPPLAPVKTKTNAKERAVSSAPPAEGDAVDAVINNLLKVSIDLRQKDWNTFRFSADVNRADGISYAWSFGDGKTERGKDITHTYTFAGRYVASVVAVQDNGERAQDKVTLDISFWNLDNWQLWLVLLILIGFVALLLGATRQERKEHPEERSAVEEGDLPPVILASDMDDPTVDAPSPTPAPKKKRTAPTRKKKKPAPSTEKPLPLESPEEPPEE